jgi:hypothetical protein
VNDFVIGQLIQGDAMADDEEFQEVWEQISVSVEWDDPAAQIYNGTLKTSWLRGKSAREGLKESDFGPNRSADVSSVRWRPESWLWVANIATNRRPLSVSTLINPDVFFTAPKQYRR